MSISIRCGSTPLNPNAPNQKQNRTFSGRSPSCVENGMVPRHESRPGGTKSIRTTCRSDFVDKIDLWTGLRTDVDAKVAIDFVLLRGSSAAGDMARWNVSIAWDRNFVEMNSHSIGESIRMLPPRPAGRAFHDRVCHGSAAPGGILCSVYLRGRESPSSATS